MIKTYRIGDVAALLNLKPFVLRFWETEFRQLRPQRTPKGQRVYTEKDVELLRRIRYLLHEKGMTIDGARRKLSGKASPAPGCPPLNTERLEARMQSLPLSLSLSPQEPEDRGSTAKNPAPAARPASSGALREILEQLRAVRALLVKEL